MNAQTLSRKLKEAGFARTTWSPVKGRGRSRASSGFQVTTSHSSEIEVVVRDWNEEVIESVHSAVIGFGFEKIAERGSVRIYKATN